MDNLDKIGERIKSIREGLMLNQSEFAEKLGLSGASAVSKYEKGQREPQIIALKKIAELGNKSLDWLIAGEFEVYNIIKHAQENGASLYATSEGTLAGSLIEERLGIPHNTLDDWLAKRGDRVKAFKPCGPSEEPLLKDILAKVIILYNEGIWDIKTRLIGAIEILFNEMKTQKEEYQKSKNKEQKKGVKH